MEQFCHVYICKRGQVGSMCWKTQVVPWSWILCTAVAMFICKNSSASWVVPLYFSGYTFTFLMCWKRFENKVSRLKRSILFFSYLNHGSYFSLYGVDCCGNSDYEGKSYQTREKFKSSWESGVHCCSTQQVASEFNKTLAIAMENYPKGKNDVLKK